MTNPFTLKNKTIFVTGASSGIGANIAKECSNMEGDVIISGRNEERLKQTFNNLLSKPYGPLVADLSKNEDIDQLIDKLPVLDGLVLCAGAIKTAPAKNITFSSVEKLFQTNTFSSIMLIKGLLKAKKIKKGGSIVFISSISSFYAKYGNALYSATKGALNSYSRVLAYELAPRKVRVNSILPGFIKSGLMSQGAVTEEQIEEHIKNYPLGAGEPQDISYATIYLLSDAARWVTGSMITIDGGVTIK